MKNFITTNKRNLIILTAVTAVVIQIAVFHAPELLTALLRSLIIAILITAMLRCFSLHIARIFLIIYAIIFAGQTASIFLTGNYIDAVALTNLDEYTSIALSARLSVIALLFFALISATSTKIPPPKMRNNTHILILGVLVLIFLYTANTKLPIISFIKQSAATTIKYYQHSHTDKLIRNRVKHLYAKNFIVEAPETHLIGPVPNLKDKNVIVFFTEALSSKKIDLFNQYSNLTPNLSTFIKKSLYFDNYYNHTFTTYRGLRGQLSSSYQYIGVAIAENEEKTKFAQKFSSELITLPQILNNNNYHTYFLSAHTNTSCNLNTMLRTIEFTRVFTPEDFASNKDFTDQQLFTALTELMTENKLKEPYFIAIYNIGTHFATDSPDLKYQNGSNDILNNIHNFDNAFGKWFDAIFSKKEIIESTAIILTADHAAFAESHYRALFNDGPQVWVDKIPLAVYTQKISPLIIDAKGRNSLSLAPTILHMLRINKAKNYFLGCSLFKLYCPLPFDHYTIGGEIYYKTMSTDAIYLGEDNYPRHILNQVEDFYHLSESNANYLD